MKYFILIFTCVFLFAAFIKNQAIAIPNSSISFIFFQLNFLIDYLLFFLIGLIVVFLFLLRAQHRHMTYVSYKLIYLSFFQTIALCLTSAFLAYVGLFLIAIIQLNITALILRSNPSLLGVVTNTKIILQTIQKNGYPPIIIASDTSSQRQTIAVSQTTVGTTNFYESTMLPSVPDFLILPVKQFPSSFLFLDNTLIVTRISQNDLQVISPMLSYLFVKEYFSTRHIKSPPQISVRTQNQFIAYAQKDTQKKIATADLDIRKMEDGVSSLSASIIKETNAISANQNLIDTSNKQSITDYDTCLSTGHYKKGIFIPQYTKAYCQTILDTWNTTITQQQKNADTLQQKLQKDQDQLKTYQYYDSFFKAQKDILAVSSNNVTDELGIFLPPNNIQIVIAPSNTHAIVDYFETLCHEYLHYASYVSGKRLDSQFFEEGLTEYFARKVIQDTMEIDTHLAYPIQVKIIETLTKRIAEPDLEDIYFTKDEAGLEKALDLAYGDNFYKDFYVSFESLQYTTDPKQALQIGNTIMDAIGGERLTEKDLQSAQSNL